ncbi:MAG: EAL domain-containing protein, partial [Lachnospiraceae bacterium]|nr:EAL domain-containing protein [Lachnospiraceae bacterium]
VIFEYDIAKDYMTYSNTGDGLLFSREITENYTRNLFDIIKADDEEAGKQLADALRSGKESFHVELRRMGTDNQYHWVSVIGKTIYDKEHKPERVLGKIRNIDAQKKREKELRDKSQKDSMTGLYNHVTIRNIINKKVARLKSGEEAYLVICDIDNFKKMNDTNGHLFGDAVICSFADEMTRLFPDAVRGRIGGDEFIVYVDYMDRQSLKQQLSRLNRAMSDRYDDEKTGIHISCSLGVVLIDGSVRDYNILFRWADSALYKVKCDGKGSYYIINAVAGEEPPNSSYLESESNREPHMRKETQIKSDEELVLFCVELLENVQNTTIALKMICERTCSFFDLDDMVCVEHNDTQKEILYQWSRVEKREYTQRMHKKGIYEWDRLFGRTDEQGVILYNEEQTKVIETEQAKAVMLAFSKDFLDYQGSIVFVDRQKDRDWKREKDTLVRISNQIFNHLSLLKSRERKQKEIDQRLNYDALTGLPVYHKFVTMVEDYIAEHSNHNLYCVYSDFSNFQYLNEKYGYETGNKVLCEFAEALSQKVDNGLFFCRVTADYFVGFVKGEDMDSAMESYYKFTNIFTDKQNQQYEQCNIVIATGIYEVRPEDKNVVAIIDNANEARKKCKEQRAVTAVFIYTEAMKREVESEKEVIANMVTAYNNQEFFAYLQPKISLATGKVVGAEALVRWIRPDGTMIMPFRFIDIAEKNGFITKVDFVVLDRVLEYLREAIDLGEEVVPVSVNFSRRHNEFKEFVPSVFRHLNRYQIPSELIEAELTETIFMADLESLRMKIESMREGGIEVSVDDFGSGYSSLNLLGKVAVDTIKIDKQFLDNTLNTSQVDKALIIIKYLIKMLKQLGFKVLAEGVETAEQVEMLKKAECDLIQGYYYAKPMPIPEFREFLKKFNQEEA